MYLKDYPFDQLPFSKLFKTYVADFPQLKSFYSANPFDLDSIKNLAENITAAGDREKKVKLLKTFNERFDLDEAAVQNLERIKNKSALTIVTGQQLGLYGGPLFTVLKIVTTIQLSKKLERVLERPVIPVFWLADEDHDFEEVNAVRLLDRDEVVSFSLSNENDTYPPVSEIRLPESFEALRDEVKKTLPDTDFTGDLWTVLDDCYQPDKKMGKAFGQLICDLFSRHGLILAGSNCLPIKEESSRCLQKAILKADEIRGVLEEQSSALDENYHRQATLYDSNLFYLADEGRSKISRNGTKWESDSGKSWSTEELIEEIEEQPVRFSPNVFLRPLLQDLLVPTLGYVAGPGELAYYGQMKKMYELFECAMPIIFPRLSATMIEPAIERIISELPFEISDYDNRIEDLESEYVSRTDQHDIEAIFDRWKEGVEGISEEYTSRIKEIDPTLEGAAGKASAVYFGELDKLKGKVYRSIKQQEETQLKRIRKIKANLFPEGTPQERVISFIYFMNKYGMDIWDQLLDELDEDENFSQHKLIYL